MFNPSYLSQSRHNVYYFRFPIPYALHPERKSSQIRISLETRCPQEALHKARCLAYVGNALTKNPAIILMDYQEIRELLHQHFIDKREKIKSHIQKYGQLPLSEVGLYKGQHELASKAVKENNLALIDGENEIQEILSELPEALPNQIANETLKLEYTKAYRDYCDSILEYNGRFDRFNYMTDQYKTRGGPPPKPAKRTLLTEAIDNYIIERTRIRGWRPDTAKGVRAQLDLMAEYLGNNAQLHVSSDVAANVKRMLTLIPTHARLKPEYKKMSIQDLMMLPNVQRMDIPSIAKYLQTYSAFYDWALKRKETEENNFKGLMERVRGKKGARDAFTKEQINLLINELNNKSSKLVKKNFQRWGTLIAIYTGARLNEIAQLEVKDIIEVDGIWCFDFNDEGEELKRLKNDASRRTVPIHSKLIEFGILEFIEAARKAGHVRILNELSYNAKNGYGRNLSRWFNDNFLPALNMKTEKLVFHSFRHTVTTELLQAGVEEAIAKSIIGHALEGVIQQVYGRGYKVKQLKEALERLYTA